MQIFDTRTRKIEELKPHHKEVRIYICGITPYDSAHLGHIFTFLIFDLIQRRLEDLGYTIKLVRNITDIDEPIFVRANENKESYKELASREVMHFQEVMSTLNFRTPKAEPLASDYIKEMASAVKQLLDSGHAYRLEKDIYFDVATFSSFGNFSGYSDHLQLALMKDRGGDPERPGKRRPLDFLLWRGISDKNDPAAWDTEVGYGRPGWHIECSVMATDLLGLPMDLHGGGMDLIFPHHECEIAQSESIHKGQFTKNWLHVAPMMYQGEKMSKSLGNLIFARDLLADGGAAAVRLMLLNYHYQIGGEWCEHRWTEAKQLAKDIDLLMHSNKGVSMKRTGLEDTVRKCIDCNLDTIGILQAVRDHVLAKANPLELRKSLALLGIEL